jgi:formiminotetrahydrofolate cyclodeaminase
MYLDRPLRKYLDDLASAQPTPGGGSAAALSGAMGAALASMVSRLTLGKADYADVQAEIETLVQKAEQLRTRFQQLVQEDIDAYGKLSASFKLPRATAEEKVARTKAIQERLTEAALVPLAMAESAAELVQYCLRIAQIGNARVLSDIATAARLAVSAGDGASWMVRVNVNSMKDQELVSTLNGRLEQALQILATVSQQVKETVEKRG